MHVGGVLLFEPTARGGAFDLEPYRRVVASRLHVARTFRQRLVTVPLDLGRPYWIEDPDFDLDFHLHHMALPRPGGWKELTRLTAHVFAQPLDRTRPLWEMTFVEGLDHVSGLPAGCLRDHHQGASRRDRRRLGGGDPGRAPGPEARRAARPRRRSPGSRSIRQADWELLTRAGGTALQPLKLANLLGRTGKSIGPGAGRSGDSRARSCHPCPFAHPAHPTQRAHHAAPRVGRHSAGPRPDQGHQDGGARGHGQRRRADRLRGGAAALPRGHGRSPVEAAGGDGADLDPEGGRAGSHGQPGVGHAGAPRHRRGRSAPAPAASSTTALPAARDTTRRSGPAP